MLFILNNIFLPKKHTSLSNIVIKTENQDFLRIYFNNKSKVVSEDSNASNLRHGFIMLATISLFKVLIDIYYYLYSIIKQ